MYKNFVSGIYQIQSKIKPKRIYIGSAIDIHQRWVNHLSLLKYNNHHSILLQRHYNKYGKNDLVFSILICCQKEDLVITEQFFIDSYNPYFNVCKIAGNKLGIKHSEKTKLKMRISHKLRDKSLQRFPRIKKPILQYDKGMNLLREWKCSGEASVTLNMSKSAIRGALTGRSKTSYGFIWKYKNQDSSTW